MFDDEELRTKIEFMGAKLKHEYIWFRLMDGQIDECLMFSFWNLFDVLFYLLMFELLRTFMQFQ